MHVEHRYYIVFFFGPFGKCQMDKFILVLYSVCRLLLFRSCPVNMCIHHEWRMEFIFTLIILY